MPNVRNHDVESLRRQLADKDSVLARGAAEALGKLRPKAAGAVDDLIRALTDHVEHGLPQVSEWATVALGKIGDPKAVPHLIQVLGSDVRTTRNAAIRALAAIGTAEAMAAVRVMLRDPERIVRKTAAKALGVGPPPDAEVMTERRAALDQIDAAWRDRVRSCPACGNAFTARQSRGKCPKCLHEFYASHPSNRHEFPF